MHRVLFLFNSGRCYRVSARCCITLLFSSHLNRHNIFTGFKPLIACESPYFTAQQHSIKLSAGFTVRRLHQAKWGSLTIV